MLLPFDRTNPKTGEVKVTVVPAWLSLVDVCFVLVLIPIMDKFVYPWLDRKGWHLSVFTRISIGKYNPNVLSKAGHLIRIQEQSLLNGINYNFFRHVQKSERINSNCQSRSD